MENHIGIRMPGETTIVRNLDAAEDETPAGHEWMDVVSLADPKSHGRPR